jgi:GGDEF domain-containing protein
MMTGNVLSNSDAFFSLLELELKRGLRYQNFISILLIEVNPPFRRGGSLNEENFLKKMVSLLTMQIRDTDLIGPTTPNRLAAVLLYSDKQSALKVADRLSSCMQDYFGADNGGRRASLGFGIACFPTHATDSKCLLKFAAEMLEKSKAERTEC